MSTTDIRTLSPAQICLRGVRMVGPLELLIGLCLFLSAGTLAWAQAWALIAMDVIYFAIFLYWGVRNDPDLLTERSRALKHESRRRWDIILILVYWLFTIALYVIAGLDHGRHHWSSVPIWVQAVAFIPLLVSYVFTFLALSNNPYASGVVRIQFERDHKVASGGPYRYLRHPMYLGNLLYSLSLPLFLDSWWALIPGVLAVASFVVRTALEDKTLREELPGYAEYAQRVKYRLVPGVW